MKRTFLSVAVLGLTLLAAAPASARNAGEYATIYIHGRYNGTPTGWQAWGRVGTGPNPVLVNWDGRKYVSSQIGLLISALDAECVGVSKPCHIACYSTGCLLTGRALAENPNRWNVTDTMAIAGADGGTELANLEWSIRNIPLFGAIVGWLTDFFNLTFPEIDYDLRTSVARAMYDHNQTSNVPFKRVSGHWNVPAERCAWYNLICHARNAGRALVREAFAAILGRDGHDGVLPYHTTQAFNGAVQARNSCPPAGYGRWTNHTSAHPSCGTGFMNVYHTDAATLMTSAPSFTDCPWVTSSLCQTTNIAWQSQFCYEGRVRQCGDLVTITSPPGAGPPVASGNDTTAGAISVAGGGTWKGTTTGTANNYTASCGSTAASPDVVYVLSVPQTSKLHVDTWGSAYDSVLHIKKDSGSGAEIGCNDDSTNVGGQWSLQSALDVTVGPGTYYIIVDGYSSAASGEFALHVEIGDPANENNDAAAGAIDVTSTNGGTFVGSTSGRANDIDATCAYSAAGDNAYVLTLTSTRTVNVNTFGSAFDTVVHIRSGSGNGTQVACNDDSGGLQSSVSASLGAGTYYIWVDGYSSNSGNYTVNISVQ